MATDLAKLKKHRYERYSLVLNEKETLQRLKKKNELYPGVTEHGFKILWTEPEYLKLIEKRIKKLEKDVERIDKQIARLEKGDKLTAKEVKRLKEDTFSIDISSTDIAQHHSKSKGDKLM